MCGSARRRVTGCPACCTTRNHAAPQPISRSREKCFHATRTAPRNRSGVNMIEKRPALGKGLSALIPDAPEPTRPGPMEVDIDRLAPNDKQPRLQMDDAKLEELAQ